MNPVEEFNLQCPMPNLNTDKVLLGHGGGGKMTSELIEKVFVPAFENDVLSKQHDGAELKIEGKRLAFSTDSYVVKPLFFPGGDIGSMAVYGTANDLAMCGANPLYLSAGFIIEEGFPMKDLWKIVQSMKAAADSVGVQLVTGDTKVVDKGKGDGIFINTSGVGVIEHDLSIEPLSIQVGDQIILSGDLGRHGIAIMAEREGLEFETTIQSDSAPVVDKVLELIYEGLLVRCLRDLTRGGLTSALNEIAESRELGMLIEEAQIPVNEQVAGACEILGLDPLYVANEGRFITFVPKNDVELALEILGEGAAHIGEVIEGESHQVFLKGRLGTTRILDRVTGEQLPRIC